MSDDLKRIEEKLDEVINALPMIYALGSVLIQRKTVNERIGISRNTIGQNKKIQKFEDAAQRKTYIEVKDISVIKKTKRPRKSR